METLKEKLELVRIADLKPHPRNYNEHPPAQVDELATSLNEHDLYRNLVISRDGYLLAGHGVALGEAQRGRTHTEAYRLAVDHDHPAALKVLAADNELMRLAITHEDQLAALLQDVRNHHPTGLRGTGFDEESLDALLDSVRTAGGDGTPPEVDDGAPPPDRLDDILEQYPVQLGDLWSLGDHRILCGSSLDPASWERLLEGRTPQMVFADPPYGVSIVTGEHVPYSQVGTHASKPFGAVGNQRGAIVSVNQYAPVIGDDSTQTAEDASTFLLQAYPKAAQVWWGANYYAHWLPPSSCWLVWHKEVSGDQGDCELAWTNQSKAIHLFTHRWNGMLRASEHGRRWHPTQKPAALAAWTYDLFGDEGDIILDPFLGSGPSLLAGESTGRLVLGCELSPAYIAICCHRWRALSGQTPHTV